jgi:uncharacterized membrane protein (UPF0127 family)
MAKFFSTLLIIVVAIVALVILGRYLIGIHAFPSLSEYVASTTSPFASSTSPFEDIGGSLFPVKAPKGTISTYVASTPDALSQGLSGRESLVSDQGMLFVFPVSGEYAFWMKDMNFPLDIVWIDADMRVVGIAKNVATSSYPENLLPPSPVRYVLELNARGSDRFGIATGTILVF